MTGAWLLLVVAIVGNLILLNRYRRGEPVPSHVRVMSLVVTVVAVMLGRLYSDPESVYQASIQPSEPFTPDQREQLDRVNRQVITKVVTWAAPAQGKVWLQMNDYAVLAELADTPDKQRQGLSGRGAPLPVMVFDCGRPYEWDIWMAGMKAPIDVFFVRGGRVVSVAFKQYPCPPVGPCPVLRAPGPVDLVVEADAGYLPVKVGQSMDIKR